VKHGSLVWVTGGALSASIFCCSYGLLSEQILRQGHSSTLQVPCASCHALIVGGATTTKNTPLDLVVVLVFGIFGYLMLRQQYPPVPFILGFILAPIVEEISSFFVNLLAALSHIL